MLNNISWTPMVASGLLILATVLFWKPAGPLEPSSRDALLNGTAALGGGRYHVQAVALPGPSLALLLAGEDPSMPHEIPAAVLRGVLRNPATAEAFQVDFAPKPLPGDAPGTTTQFVTALPVGINPMHVEISLPELHIGGERFRASLALHSASTIRHHGTSGEGASPTMPEKVADSAEEALYLTPGGIYTEADIEANGHLTASQRFQGFRAEHDKNPRPGDPICPVTETKANPEAPWIIGGQTYLFCCPPCIDEFLAMAKETPEKIQPAAAYVQK